MAFYGKLFALDRATGRVAWRTQIDNTSYSVGNAPAIELAIGDDVIVACTVNNLVFVEYATGRLLRNVPRSESGRATMLFDQGQLIVSALGAVSCYTLQGELVWQQPFSGEGYGVIAAGFPGNVRQADG
ncbi:hypothetical protein AKJ09_08970 [Labilithrix luteola]|uniref:Uncharacterized protein n=1 Tax=Labilithrix luteola TaxID=1391654 RepID=A0A0K1Q9H1_9BACT|nr:PQQ-binding-like beta-propeller repeat protein [Labilithrix luteola]AKV02307.1 hypothetical protein AKJ09_08970 [Labilithrix luteola]